jgi:YesN/AraC family two-component response regulator
MPKTIYIKYMVSQRCKLLVKDELMKLGIEYVAIDLGVIELSNPITTEQKVILRANLIKSGLELLDDKKSILIEKIKTLVIEMIHYAESDTVSKNKFSVYLAETIGYDYTYLSNVFSEVKGITIEQYIITNKIERVKELILYNELNLSEIARKLQYSSVAHISAQFKKVTGLTPSFFKQLAENKRRIALEDL